MRLVISHASFLLALWALPRRASPRTTRRANADSSAAVLPSTTPDLPSLSPVCIMGWKVASVKP